MRKIFSLVTGVIACAGLSAQGFTSPVGLEGLEGNGLSTINFAYYANCRLQYSDGNQRGAPKVINKMSFRRDGTGNTSGRATARTVDLGVLMSHTDVSGGAPSTTFANNYIGTPTQVFTVKPVSLPDYNTPPLVPPAPFDIPLMFDAPFNYDGVNDFLWEITGQNNSAAASQTYYIDTATNGTTAYGGIGNFYYNGGVACIVPPNTSQFDIISSGAQTDAGGMTSIGWYALRGPVSSPGVLAIGASDPNLSGVFCAPLRTSAEIFLPVSTDASGNIASSASRFTISVPFSQPLWVYSQFAAFETSTSRLYLSDATAHEIVPHTPPVTRICYAVRNTSSATALTGSASTFAIVVKFE